MHNLYWFKILYISDPDPRALCSYTETTLDFSYITLLYFGRFSKNCTFAPFFILHIEKKDDSWFFCFLIYELPQHWNKMWPPTAGEIVTAMVTSGYLLFTCKTFIFAFQTKTFVLFIIQRMAAVITGGKQ